MTERASQVQPDGGKLTSWKEIAAFFDRDVRTVIRWEKELGLPVHRDLRKKRGTVHAYRPELEQWQEARRLAPQNPAALWRRRAVLAALAAVVGMAGAALFFDRTRPSSGETLEARPLTAFEGEEINAAISPDGERVAFVWTKDGPGDYDVFVMPTAGASEAERLTDSEFGDFSPAWSPDGSEIAFFREESFRGPTRLMLLSLSDRSEREILRSETVWHGDHGIYLTWAPHGRYLVASLRESADDPARLFRVSPDSGEKQPLTDPARELRGDTGPAVTQDGRRLAFVRLSTRQVGHLYLLDLTLDGEPLGEPARLTQSASWISSPRWLPDGTGLLYAAGWLGATALWTIEVAGGEPQKLPMLRDDLHLPAISVDGDKLVYTRRIENHNIWAVDLDSPGSAVAEPKRLLGSSRLDTNPDVSPDGSAVAFDSYRSGSGEVWIAQADGSQARQLTHFGGALSGSPRWSPDGRLVALDSRAGGQAEIYMVDPSGGEPQRFTTHPSDDIVPTWSLDGRTVYFASQRGGREQHWEVWKKPIAGGEAEQLTTKGGLYAEESPDGEWLYFAKLEFPSSLWKVPIDGGEEERVLESLYWYNSFRVGREGIYYIPHAQPNGGSTLDYLDLATGVSRTLATIDRPVQLGLGISPDESMILFSQADQAGSDLMLVEGFQAP